MPTPFLVDESVEPTRARLIRMILTLAELFGETLSNERTAAYVEALRDVPIDDLRLGVQRHIRNSSWFPKPADLRAAVDRERDARETVAPPPVDVICTRCDDAGWVIVAERTDRAQPTATRCACYATNPKLTHRAPLVVSDGRADRENWR